MAGVAALCGIGALQSLSIYWAGLIVLAVLTLGIPVFRVLFFLKTGQLATPTVLLANVTYIMGYVQWPPTWPNSFVETPKRLSWAEVHHASLDLKPWIFATDNVQLTITLNGGKTLVFRVPRITDEEYGKLVETLGAIGRLRGFSFSTEMSPHAPLH